ncbi:MAG: amidohydrolase family protein, partial [Chloroflexi bacterium]|nr:amidohydrolase family protein [Chloroflexota bacterium]
IEAGIDTLEHLQGFSQEEMDLIVSHGVILVPTLTATKCTVDVGTAPQADPAKQQRFISWMQQNWRDKQAGMKRALAAGVRMAVGTDAGYAHCLHGANAYEMELLVQEGMSPMQGLVAATSTAAEALQLEEEIGSLRPGHYADLLIVEGQPHVDISVLRDVNRIKAICKNGRFVKEAL